MCCLQARCCLVRGLLKHRAAPHLSSFISGLLPRTSFRGRNRLWVTLNPRCRLCLGVQGGDFSRGTGLMLLSMLLHASPAEPGLRPVLPLNLRQVS